LCHISYSTCTKTSNTSVTWRNVHNVNGPIFQPWQSQIYDLKSFLYNVSQKITPPLQFSEFFSNGLEFLIKILLAYYTFTFTLNYKISFSYLQL